MKNFNIFIIRLVLGGAIAVVLTRLFYPSAKTIHAAALGIVLVGAAYFLEYLRNRRSD